MKVVLLLTPVVFASSLLISLSQKMFYIQSPLAHQKPESSASNRLGFRPPAVVWVSFFWQWEINDESTRLIFYTWCIKSPSPKWNAFRVSLRKYFVMCYIVMCRLKKYPKYFESLLPLIHYFPLNSIWISTNIEIWMPTSQVISNSAKWKSFRKHKYQVTVGNSLAGRK